MNIQCLIVDDEPLARKVLENHLKLVPQFQLVGSCKDALEANPLLLEHSIDLVFLDINMPGLSGIEWLSSLPNPPQVIFTTAYPEYAVQGFELDAIDYLVKPISRERFLKAANKFLQRSFSPNNQQTLIIKADKKLFKIPYEEILYLQAYGDYVKVTTQEKTYLTKEKLSALEVQLTHSGFLRIHRSHIVSLKAIEYLEGNHVSINGVKIPISNKYKEVLLDRFGRA